MRPVLYVISLLVALAISALPSAASYFPLAPGATWVRRGDDGAQIAARVTGTQVVGGAVCTVIETISTLSGRRMTTHNCYRAAPTAILLVATETGGRATVFDPPSPVLLLPPTSGKRWTWTPKNPSMEPESNEWVREETIRVAAGSFRAWKLRTTTRRGTFTFTLTTWYAPHVGIVKIQREASGMSRQATRTSELVSYTIP